MVRICTGEVCVRSSRRSRSGFDSCPAMKSVSCVSRADGSGKVQRLEIVVIVSIPDLLDRVAQIAEDAKISFIV